MKKLLLLFFFLLIPIKAFAAEEVDVYLFYGEGCPHCEAEEEFLDEIKEEYNLNINTYEVCKTLIYDYFTSKNFITHFLFFTLYQT